MFLQEHPWILKLSISRMILLLAQHLLCSRILNFHLPNLQSWLMPRSHTFTCHKRLWVRPWTPGTSTHLQPQATSLRRRPRILVLMSYTNFPLNRTPLKRVVTARSPTMPRVDRPTYLLRCNHFIHGQVGMRRGMEHKLLVARLRIICHLLDFPWRAHM